jgi:MioC protein
VTTDQEPVIILVASMSGTAEMVADELEGALRATGQASKIVRMERASLAMFAKRTNYIICSSTYGRGDVPDNGQAFYQLLVQERPDLSHVRYGVVALGDMTYTATFCGGGAKFDQVLAELGAQRLVPRMQHDAKSGIFPEVQALQWLQGWLKQFRLIAAHS